MTFRKTTSLFILFALGITLSSCTVSMRPQVVQPVLMGAKITKNKDTKNLRIKPLKKVSVANATVRNMRGNAAAVYDVEQALLRTLRGTPRLFVGKVEVRATGWFGLIDILDGGIMGQEIGMDGIVYGIKKQAKRGRR